MAYHQSYSPNLNARNPGASGVGGFAAPPQPGTYGGQPAPYGGQPAPYGGLAGGAASGASAFSGSAFAQPPTYGGGANFASNGFGATGGFGGGYTPSPYASRAPPAAAHSSGFWGQVKSNPYFVRLEDWSSTAEDVIDTYTHPLKPYLPGFGRFLIVATFLEDSFRLLTHWGDQVYFLQKHRHIPWGLTHIFLIINMIVMTGASISVIARRYPEASVGALLGIQLCQGLAYGMLSDWHFVLRTLSITGGLLMCLSDSLAMQKKSQKLFAGLPSLGVTEGDKNLYLQLAGRVLLVVLFIGFAFHGEWSLLRAVTIVLGLGACAMVAVGFKARWSASFLVLLLSVFNLAVNNFWTVNRKHPSHDFLRYDFFQTLSIVGGLLLLVNMGPGSYSIDEGKKAT